MNFLGSHGGFDLGAQSTLRLPLGDIGDSLIGPVHRLLGEQLRPAFVAMLFVQRSERRGRRGVCSSAANGRRDRVVARNSQDCAIWATSKRWFRSERLVMRALWEPTGASNQCLEWVE